MGAEVRRNRDDSVARNRQPGPCAAGAVAMESWRILVEWMGPGHGNHHELMQLRSGRIARTAVGAVFIGSLFTLSVWLAAGLAQEPSITSAGMRQAEGLLIARCAVCHSTDLVVQQRLARPAWEAT